MKQPALSLFRPMTLRIYAPTERRWWRWGPWTFRRAKVDHVVVNRAVRQLTETEKNQEWIEVRMFPPLFEVLDAEKL